jgi:hypothetical protein
MLEHLLSLSGIAIAHADGFEIVTGIPGSLDPQTYGILGYIQNGYLMALGVAGLLALGSIAWGAVQYTVSRGNPSKLSDAWDRILQALIGVVLLVGAGTLLTIINPGLLSLQLPKLQQVESTPYQQGAFIGQIPEEDEDRIDPNTGKVTNTDTVPPTVSCKTDPKKCVSLADKGFTCAVTKARCLAHEQVAAALECAAKKVGISNSDIRITEGYPPTYTHVSSGHTNGCIADVTLSKTYQSGGCAAIKAFAAAVSSCGGYALNEYAGYDSFSGKNYAGCGVKPVNKSTGKVSWTGNNVHVRGCPSGTLP